MPASTRSNEPLTVKTNFPSMRDALLMLKQHGIPTRKVSEYQIKIGQVNYYPGKGSIYLDGATRPMDEHGFRALLRFLEAHRDLW